MRGPGVVLLICLLTGTLGTAQQVRDQATQTPVGTGVLTGVVTTAGDSPVPVRRAVLSVSGGPLRTSLLAVTDADGRFEFRNLPPGRFTLDARKAGFVREVYGAVTVGATVGASIPVGDGITSVSMALLRSASLSGHVMLPPGGPVSAVRLQLLRWDTVGGRRQLVSARGGAFALSRDGRYRIGGLPPGAYVVVAYPFGRVDRRLFEPDRPGPVVSLAPVYVPGNADPTQALAVRLEAGEDRIIDIPMDFVETGRAQGRVFGPDGTPMAGAQVSVTSGLPAIAQPQPMRAAADGTFALTALVPGMYTVIARGAPAGLPPAGPPGSLLASQPQLPLWAQTTIVVAPGSSQEGLDLHLQPGRTVRGRFVLAPGAEGAVNVSGLFVRLEADQPPTTAIGVPVVAPGADRSFTIPGVAPGQYRLRVTIPDVLQSSVFVVGMDAGGQDVLDGPLNVGVDGESDVVITVTTDPSVVDVTVHDGEGRPAPGQPVVVFPRDAALRVVPSRRIVVTRAGADGVAVVRALPDGVYMVSALTGIPDDGAQTAAWFESIAGTAAAIDVRDGRQTSVTISSR